MEGLWSGWHFAMIGMKIYSDEGYGLSFNVNACVLATFKNFQLGLLFQMPCSSYNLFNTFQKICILISSP